MNMNCDDFSGELGRTILGDAAANVMIIHAAGCNRCAKRVYEEHKQLIIRRSDKNQVVPYSIVNLSAAIRRKLSGKA